MKTNLAQINKTIKTKKPLNILETFLSRGGYLKLKLRIAKCIDVYNNTQHLAIGMSPNQALNPERREEVKRNQLAYIIKQHKNLLSDNKRKYSVGELIFIKDEKIRVKGQPRFNKVGTVVEIGDYDTYKIKIYGTSKKK